MRLVVLCKRTGVLRWVHVYSVANRIEHRWTNIYIRANAHAQKNVCTCGSTSTVTWSVLTGLQLFFVPCLNPAWYPVLTWLATNLTLDFVHALDYWFLTSACSWPWSCLMFRYPSARSLLTLAILLTMLLSPVWLHVTFECLCWLPLIPALVDTVCSCLQTAGKLWQATYHEASSLVECPFTSTDLPGIIAFPDLMFFLDHWVYNSCHKLFNQHLQTLLFLLSLWHHLFHS